MRLCVSQGQPLDQAQAVAESRATAILGRETAYSGRMLEWDDALNAKQDLSAAKLELGLLPMPPVAMPGK